MSSHDDAITDPMYVYLNRGTCARAIGVLMIRLNLPVDAASGYLRRGADEIGVEEVELAYLIVRGLDCRRTQR